MVEPNKNPVITNKVLRSEGRILCSQAMVLAYGVE